MIEDQLTRDERIRLEALAQANTSRVGMNFDPFLIIDTAKKFEKYIREEEQNAAE